MSVDPLDDALGEPRPNSDFCDPDAFASLIAQVEAMEATARPASAFVDWSTFWDRDRSDADWIDEGVLARGRSHAIYAGHKTGKSLFMLERVAKIAGSRKGVVVYLDFEMTGEDLFERLDEMGYGADSDLTRLRYALLPTLPPLDTSAGAAALLALLDGVQADFPGEHLVVIIDTTGRAVAGDENSADTVRAFYRWTGLVLKQRGITWARLDHAGKDAARGQRGSSAKGDDVDIVWRLARTDTGLELQRDAARMTWVPERSVFHMSTDPLRFVPVAMDWPHGTREVADLLDTLTVDLTHGERPAGKALRDAGHKHAQNVIRAAVKYRRQRASDGVR